MSRTLKNDVEVPLIFCCNFCMSLFAHCGKTPFLVKIINFWLVIWLHSQLFVDIFCHISYCKGFFRIFEQKYDFATVCSETSPSKAYYTCLKGYLKCNAIVMQFLSTSKQTHIIFWKHDFNMWRKDGGNDACRKGIVALKIVDLTSKDTLLLHFWRENWKLIFRRQFCAIPL